MSVRSRTLVSKIHPLRVLLSMALPLLLSACGQIEVLRLYLANTGSEVELSRQLPITLPFRDVDGWIIVSGSINGSPPVDFVIDTGAPILAVLASTKTAALDFDMSGAHRLGGDEHDLATPYGAIQEKRDIAFGPLTFKEQTLFAIPVETLSCAEGGKVEPPFQGIIGYDLLHRFVVEVNYDRQELTLHAPDSYRYRGKEKPIVADISGREMYIQAQFRAQDNPPHTSRLHVDTGANIDISLFPMTDPGIAVPEDGPLTSACFVGGKANYRSGTAAITLESGRELTSPTLYALDRESINSDENGRMGARFIRRFNPIFDYPNGRLILEPRASET